MSNEKARTIDAKKEAMEFKDQAYEFFVNDILRLGWKGDFNDYLREYGLYEKLNDYVEFEKWSKDKRKSFTNEVISEIKKDYYNDVAELIIKEKIELDADTESIDYYVNKVYLTDDTIEANEDLSDEAIQKYIESYKDEIKRREPIIAALEKILKQLGEDQHDQD